MKPIAHNHEIKFDHTIIKKHKFQLHYYTTLHKTSRCSNPTRKPALNPRSPLKPTARTADAVVVRIANVAPESGRTRIRRRRRTERKLPTATGRRLALRARVHEYCKGFMV